MLAEIQFGAVMKNSEPLHPGRILLERAMEPLGISRNQLARDIDVPVGRISDITNGKRGITADTALRFGRYFDTGPELWLRLQAEYDLHVARNTTWSEIEKRVRVLNTPSAQSSPMSSSTGSPSSEALASNNSNTMEPTSSTAKDDGDGPNNMGIPPAPKD